MIVYIILACILTLTFREAMPYVIKWWKSIKPRKKRESPNVYCDDLSKRIDELEKQMDNVAKNHYNREQNRKSNIRRDVREYLKELRDGE